MTATIPEFNARKCPVEIDLSRFPDDRHEVASLFISAPEHDRFNFYCITSTGFHIWGESDIDSEATFDDTFDPESEFYEGESPRVVVLADPLSSRRPVSHRLVDPAAFEVADWNPDPASEDDQQVHVEYICIDVLGTLLTEIGRAEGWEVPA